MSQAETIRVPTPDRILDAAEVLFAERGFAGTPVRDIAARVGLNPASLYNHFPSKQAIYEAVLERGVRPLIDILEVAAHGELDPDWGDRILETVMSQLERTPHLPRLIQHEAVSGGEHLARLARRWLLPPYAQALAAVKRGPGPGLAGWDDEELPLLVIAWLNMIFGYFAMAPLTAELLDRDPLSRENLERQTRFLRKLALRLAGGD
ncbi:MAG: TetR family transcriptional regulator [Proteobacteria bacterium]|nr:TetR family transcriptional regulator [Pseudomonadota bacterium]